MDKKELKKVVREAVELAVTRGKTKLVFEDSAFAALGNITVKSNTYLSLYDVELDFEDLGINLSVRVKENTIEDITKHMTGFIWKLRKKD